MHTVAIDQGTTSTRAIVFDSDATIRAVAQREFTQHFPQPGWVEHDPEEIWNTVVATAAEAIAAARLTAADIAAIGITNQRETTILWERDSGKPIAPAIVWQDRRTADLCAQWRQDGAEQTVAAKSGLLLDPYFSASKIAYLLRQDPALARRAAVGEVLFGTVDAFLLWRLSGGKTHQTDATNAARTMLFNIHSGDWDDDLLALFDIPRAMLPAVNDCAADFAVTDVFGGRIAVCGVAGDQHAAAIGQACFAPGMLKSTYGTGCFALLNTGDSAVRSQNRLLTTLAYQLAGRRVYALEGAIFIAGAAVQWLRDGLRIINDAADSGELAAQADDAQEVILAPAFTGLGAPYWRADARGAVFGLTRATGRNELCRAALEAVCYQTRDLITAMESDWRGSGGQRPLADAATKDRGSPASDGAGGGQRPQAHAATKDRGSPASDGAGGGQRPLADAAAKDRGSPASDGAGANIAVAGGGDDAVAGGGGSVDIATLRVDGGMAASDWTMQRLADLLGAAVERPAVLETTAWGAAYLAGYHQGIYPSPDSMAKQWRMQKRFAPQMPAAIREQKYAAWQSAIKKLLS